MPCTVFTLDNREHSMHIMIQKKSLSVTQAHYCNLGRSLAAGDINGDGFLDLLIGSPFSGAKGEQRGMVSALLSDKKYQGIEVY